MVVELTALCLFSVQGTVVLVAMWTATMSLAGKEDIREAPIALTEVAVEAVMASTKTVKDIAAL